MKDILKINIAIIGMAIGFVILILVIAIGLIKIAMMDNQYNNKDEQIKILEQSLQEQIQEKEVYMRMLEANNE